MAEKSKIVLPDSGWFREVWTIVLQFDAEALAQNLIQETAYDTRVPVMGKECDTYRALFLRPAEAGDCIVLREIA